MEIQKKIYTYAEHTNVKTYDKAHESIYTVQGRTQGRCSWQREKKDICATSKIAMSDGMSLNSLDKDRWKCYKERWALYIKKCNSLRLMNNSEDVMKVQNEVEDS